MITKKQVDEALKVIRDYEQQLLSNVHKIKDTTQAGCQVRLSEWGREMQKPHNKIGIVIDYLPWMGLKTDGIVTVKWANKLKPQDMHISQIEAIKK